MSKTTPPWDAATVEALNRTQQNPAFHPFTCGGNRSDQAHRDYARQHGARDHGVLVATPQGWRCPVPGCGYTQGWAHTFMVEGGRK